MPLMRRLPRVSLFCGLLAFLTLGNGCKGKDPVAVAPTYTRSVAVEFAVRDGSKINPIGTQPVFDLSPVNHKPPKPLLLRLPGVQ